MRKNTKIVLLPSQFKSLVLFLSIIMVNIPNAMILSITHVLLSSQKCESQHGFLNYDQGGYRI